ncbi:MAG: 1,4-alpha-glucan branching protein GlgB [Eubacteriaceae bacterium]|nr:1,4-alpha-glucan branching protein GlgB [Eubacteriaceae bacterium]
MSRKIFTDEEKYLFAEGTYYRAFDKFGAHPDHEDGKDGYRFTLWVPDVNSVRVVGDFNSWDAGAHFMNRESNDIYTLFIPGVEEGATYKYVVETREGVLLYKADPYAFYAQKRPETASRTYDLSTYRWKDKKWMNARARANHMERPMNIYEVNLTSWKMHGPDELYTYEELADELVSYVKDMGYTHVEIMPVMEHPFDGSWGYQVTGYYAATARYGDPRGLMSLIDAFHRAEIGVILDWVPGHFCRDAHGLGAFNGRMVYEKRDHEQWGTYVFDFGRGQVKSFLTSNVVFWLEKFHADGIRVDGVSSILYRNYGIEDESKKTYNADGSEGDLDAIKFLQDTNKVVGEWFPNVCMIAEESTAWPLVTRPPEVGGLGFHYKWDMGWMHDTLDYMRTDFPFRPYHHNMLTFSMMYAYNENFVLPLSHDEVVHGKCSLIRRMPGDYWRQFAGLRTLLLYQMTHPGHKLNFMGNEIGQFIEWRDYESIEWFLAEEYEAHSKHQKFVKEINGFYKDNKALWLKEFSWDGFQWLDADNNNQSICSYIRHGSRPIDDLIVVINFTPATYDNFRVGVPKKGMYKEVFNSDLAEYGGSGVSNKELVKSEDIPLHGMEDSVAIKLPPLGGVILKRTTVRKTAAKKTADKKPAAKRK